MKLIIRESDLDGTTRAKLEYLSKGEVPLEATTEDANEVLFDALPGVVARRLRKMTPPDFEVSEIQMKLDVSGKVMDFGIAGAITVKLSAKPGRAP